MSDDRLEAIRFSAQSLDRVVASIFGDGTTVRAEQRAGGGSINRTSVLELSDGSRLFLKRNSASHHGLFEEEARGLLALSQAEGPRVPKVHALFESPGTQNLLMEHIGAGRKTADFYTRFGRELARLHRSNRNSRCGFERDNHIGSTPQRNSWTGSWHEFFGWHRLLYQAELAREKRLGDETLLRCTEILVKKLPDLLPDVDDERPSLIHGDLWGGNYMVGDGGEPVLIDPAVYYGHREADLAMTELFGGFSHRFYRAYAEEWPLEPGYEQRRDLYNLYHLLNHLNLFGGGYLGSCRAILKKYASC